MPDPSGERPREVSSEDRRDLGCASQTASNAIRAFNETRPRRPHPGSSRPKRVHAAFDEEGAEALREMLHRSPREFGRQSSLWTLEMVADVAFEEGSDARAHFGRDHPGHFVAPSFGAVDAGQAVDHFSGPTVRKKKRRRGRLMRVAAANLDTWVVGFEDECWWSRLALPTLNGWAEEGKPLRLLQRSVAKDDPEPKAISCYGLFLPEIARHLAEIRGWKAREFHNDALPFVVAEELEEIGKKVLLLIWDNASWHVSKEVRRWLGRHNREVKKSGRRSEDRQLPFAQEEPVAERHRAQVGAREAQGSRAGRASRSIRACREGVPGFRLPSSRASHRRTEGRLIMH